MPFFTLQLSQRGEAYVDALVGVSKARHGALTSAGQPIPNPVRIRGLIDTGANISGVDPSVLQSLQIAPTGAALVNTASSGSTPRPTLQYDISLLIPGAVPTHVPLVVENLPVFATQLVQAQGFHALIGTDVLSECLFMYNGQMKFFSVAY